MAMDEVIALQKGTPKAWESSSPDANGASSDRDRDDVDMRRMVLSPLPRQTLGIPMLTPPNLGQGAGIKSNDIPCLQLCKTPRADTHQKADPSNAGWLLAVAGTGGTIVIYIANFFGFLTIVLSLAEMSSIAPTAGGQYHWTSEMAPPKLQKFLSYVSGWLSSLSWLVGVASAMYLAGNIIPAMISLMHPTYVPQPYQGYLFVVLICVICFSINTFLAKQLPILEGFVLGFMLAAFITTIAVLLSLSPKLTGSEVFQSFGEDLGQTGILELVALQVLMAYSLLGSDSTAHMAEETREASLVIPRAMVASYIINGIANLAVLIVYCYCWVDPETALQSPTGFPFLQVFVTATGSAGGAVALASIQIVLIILSITNFMASTSRQVFAFARDNGLPFKNFVARVNTRTKTPTNSLVVVSAFVVLICLIGLGSEVAFNAIVGLQVMALAGTYEVSILSLIWRRCRGKPLPPCAWSCGAWGMPLNVLGALYGAYLLVYSAMPIAYPVTAATFNWAPVMFGGVMAMSLLYYLVWARRSYSGPVVYVVQ